MRNERNSLRQAAITAGILAALGVCTLGGDQPRVWAAESSNNTAQAEAHVLPPFQFCKAYLFNTRQVSQLLDLKYLVIFQPTSKLYQDNLSFHFQKTRGLLHM